MPAPRVGRSGKRGVEDLLRGGIDLAARDVRDLTKGSAMKDAHTAAGRVVQVPARVDC